MEERMRVVALLLACAAAAVAADAPPVDAKALAEAKNQAKAVYSEANQKGDIWTGLQMEAWAAAQHVSLRGAPMLAGSEVFGDPLLACPDEIHQVVDRGDAVEVLATRRFYAFAPDGRPVACSVPLGLRCDRGDVAFDHGWIGAVQFDTREDQPSLWLAHTVSAKGDANVQLEFEEPRGVVLGEGEVRVADDGSVLAVPFAREDANDVRVVVVGGKAKRVEYSGLIAPIGVAPGGAWLIAQRYENDSWMPVLAMGGDRQPLRSAAMGPGIAAVIPVDGGLYLIDRAGKRSPVALPLALGNEARVYTLGRWLIVASGPGAKSLPSTDLLGVEIPDPPPQPESIAIFRWDDLAADPKATAVARYQNPCEPARHLPAGLILWRGQQVDVLDLSGRQPTVRPFYTASKEVAWAYSRRFGTRVNFRSGGDVLIDSRGRELWSGNAEIEPWSRDLAVTCSNPKAADATYELVHLAPETKDRKVIKLDLGGGQWEVACDAAKERWMARQGRAWQFGDLTGTIIGRGAGRRSRPPFDQPGWPPIGRFYFRYGRVFAKDADEGNEAARLAPQDAWLLQRMLLVIDRDSHVWVIGGARKGAWSDLGAVDDARRFGIVNKEEPVVAGDDLRVLGTFGPGPNGPVIKPEKPGRTAEPLPDSLGPWRMTDTQQFAPPHSGAMEWSDDKAGFTARELHSPKGDPAELLVVTASVVIGLDPQVAKMVAASVKR